MPSASLARCSGRASSPASRSIATQTTCRWPELHPSGSLMLTSGTRLSAGYARYFLRATPGAVSTVVAGGTAIHEQTWGELAQAFGGLTVSGRVGSATSDARRRTQHAIGIQWRTSDRFTIGVEQSRRVRRDFAAHGRIGPDGAALPRRFCLDADTGRRPSLRKPRPRSSRMGTGGGN